MQYSTPLLLLYLLYVSLNFNSLYDVSFSVNDYRYVLMFISAGLEVAARLIKLVTAELQDLYPSIETYSTLSPVPGFLKWLNQIAKVTVH